MKKKLILFIVNSLCSINVLSPIKVAKLKFYYKFHRWPNFEHPHDLNEKMNWMKFYGDSSMWPDLADKYKVREFVEKKGLKDILVHLYGKWDEPRDIDWDILPNQFVIKANNGSGDVLVCKDKSKINKSEVIDYFQKILSKPYGVNSGEPHYSKIKPCVVIEEFLDASTQSVKTSSLIDYKIWCFNGTPKFIWTCYNRTKHSTEVATFDTEWNFHPEYSIYSPHYSQAQQVVPKPTCLNEMLRIASILSENMPILRCDLYEVNGKVYFGEMTFTSLGGFMDYMTKEFLDLAGDMITLPFEERKKNKNK